MKMFTYFLRVVSTLVFIVAACNTNIDNIPSYIIVTVLSFAIAVTLWQCANALDEAKEQQHTNKKQPAYTPEQLQRGA